MHRCNHAISVESHALKNVMVMQLTQPIFRTIYNKAATISHHNKLADVLPAPVPSHNFAASLRQWLSANRVGTMATCTTNIS